MDPFTLANKTYLSHISARANAFLVPMAEPYPDPDDDTRSIFNLNLTLLPRQIFILPVSLKSRLNQSIFETHAIYTDNEIRYFMPMFTFVLSGWKR